MLPDRVENRVWRLLVVPTEEGWEPLQQGQRIGMVDAIEHARWICRLEAGGERVPDRLGRGRVVLDGFGIRPRA